VRLPCTRWKIETRCACKGDQLHVDTGYPCRVSKPAARSRKSNKGEVEEESECEEDDDDEDKDDRADKSYKPSKGSKGKDQKQKPAPKAASKDGQKVTNKADPDACVPKYMEKYTTRDLNHGKGDLEGLIPYSVGQILDIETEKCSGKKGVVLAFVTSPCTWQWKNL
jgi:hypothetical protein